MESRSLRHVILSGFLWSLFGTASDFEVSDLWGSFMSVWIVGSSSVTNNMKLGERTYPYASGSIDFVLFTSNNLKTSFQSEKHR